MKSCMCFNFQFWWPVQVHKKYNVIQKGNIWNDDSVEHCYKKKMIALLPVMAATMRVNFTDSKLALLMLYMKKYVVNDI